MLYRCTPICCSGKFCKVEYTHLYNSLTDTFLRMFIPIGFTPQIYEYFCTQNY